MPTQQDYLNKIKEDQFVEFTLGEINLRFNTTWGLFSPKEIDRGTQVLLHEVNVKDPRQILDLGCGYGAIGLTLAKKYPDSYVTMVDKDFVAVEYSKKNASLNGLKNVDVIMSNGFSALPEDRKFDLIISNLPAKVGKELFHIWLHESFERLNPGGELWVVTIAGLREFIKRNLKEVFGNYEKVVTANNFTVGKAVK